MKIKTLARIGGATETALFGYAFNFCYNIMSNVDYQKLQDFFLGDYPIRYKVLTGIFLPTTAIMVPITALGVVDGLVDLVKGTHHYFGMQLWKKLTRNQKRKEEIDTQIKNLTSSKEKTILSIEEIVNFVTNFNKPQH